MGSVVTSSWTTSPSVSAMSTKVCLKMSLAGSSFSYGKFLNSPDGSALSESPIKLSLFYMAISSISLYFSLSSFCAFKAKKNGFSFTLDCGFSKTLSVYYGFWMLIRSLILSQFSMVLSWILSLAILAILSLSRSASLLISILISSVLIFEIIYSLSWTVFFLVNILSIS